MGVNVVPSQTDDIMTTKMIIDATRPVQRPYAARLSIPKDAMERVDIEDFIPAAIREQIGKA